MTPSSNSFWQNAASLAWRHRGLLACLVLAVVVYFYFVSGLSNNPPGFYLDEASIAFNAFSMATTGKSESGAWFPLYFQSFTESKIQYLNPVYVYGLAIVYLFVPPSVLSARLFSATAVFVAAILLGILGARISGRRLLGVIVGLSALATPWLFEPSRLVFEVALYPLALAFLLLCMYNASGRPRWSVGDVILIGIGLGLCTYTYTIGRLLGPAFALGLVIFIRGGKSLLSVVKTWLVYLVTLVPFIVEYFTNTTAITGRFNSVTYVDLANPWETLGIFWDAYRTDIGLKFLLDEGDPLLRHHVPGSGELLAATFAVAMIGVIVVLFRYWRERWWWFIVYGLLLGIAPGALTVQRYHSLRTIAFPVFLIVLTVPAMMWLLGPPEKNAGPYKTFIGWLDGLPERLIDAAFEWKRMLFNGKLLGSIILVVVLVLTFQQAYDFQVRFRELGPTRGEAFDQAYLPIFEQAIAQPDRPIYLEDGLWGPAYIHAFWYGAMRGIDLSNFYHLADREQPPVGSLVISSNNSCERCEVFRRTSSYLLYKTTGREGVIDSSAPPAPVNQAPSPPAEPAYRAQVISPDASKPHGMTVDAAGNIFLADSAHARILKLSPSGEKLATFAENTLGEPNGIAIDAAGNIYVADAGKKAVFKFKPDGTLIKQLGADAGFDEVRDLVIGSDRHLYVTDRGRSRVVRMDLEGGDISAWGSGGSSDGQFNTANGITVEGENIYVCDTVNDRVEVFNPNGTFIRSWPVPQWANYLWHRPDVVVDQKADRVYITSGWSHELLVFDKEGAFIGSLRVEPPARFNNPSSILLSETKSGKSLYILDTGADLIDTGPPSILVIDLSEQKK